MNSSESIAKLSAALTAAQAEMKNPAFDAFNPHFKNKFASLVSVREAVLPILNKNQLSVTQFPKAANGVAGCVTRLMHSSGEWLEEECLLPLTQNTAQGAGSAITYARRYSLQSIAGVVADEDEDGNASAPQVSKPAPDEAGKKILEGCGSMAALSKAWSALTQDQRLSLNDVKEACKKRIQDADKAAAAQE